MSSLINVQNKQAQETSGSAMLGLVTPVPFNVGAGGAVAKVEEHNSIHHFQLEDPGYTIIGRSRRLNFNFLGSTYAYRYRLKHCF